MICQVRAVNRANALVRSDLPAGNSANQQHKLRLFSELGRLMWSMVCQKQGIVCGQGLHGGLGRKGVVSMDKDCEGCSLGEVSSLRTFLSKSILAWHRPFKQ